MSMKKPFVPEELLNSLCTDKNLEKLFSASAGIWEGYSIREHTLMVMKMFENFWACCIPDEQKKLWRMFLALHDIGKPIAIARFGDKGKQHATTLPIIRQVMSDYGFSDAEIYRAELLVDQDTIGLYLKDQIYLEDAVNRVIDIHYKGGWPVPAVLQA